MRAAGSKSPGGSRPAAWREATEAAGILEGCRARVRRPLGAVSDGGGEHAGPGEAGRRPLSRPTAHLRELGGPAPCEPAGATRPTRAQLPADGPAVKPPRT